MSKLELEVQNTQSIEHLFEPDGWNRTAELVLWYRMLMLAQKPKLAPWQEIMQRFTAVVSFSAMRAGGEMDDKIPHAPVESFVQAPYLDEAVEAVCQSPIDCVGLAFTSSAYKHGPDGERALIERLKPVAREIPIVSTCLSAERALKKLGTQKLAVVNPAWFDYDLSAQGASYFEKAGFNVVHHSSCGIQSGQKYVTPQALYTWIKDVVLDSGADTVFVGGNGQRSVGIIKAVEETLGVTIITGNQLILWDALRSIGSDAKIERYGRLFS